MFLWCVVIKPRFEIESVDLRQNEIAFGRMQITARWVAAKRPLGLAGLLPGADPALEVHDLVTAERRGSNLWYRLAPEAVGQLSALSRSLVPGDFVPASDLEFTLELLVPLYRRISAAMYRYESAVGMFVTELQVNTAVFVMSYPNIWHVEAST